jgi:uncharacterized protein (TIGR02246 family)
MAEKAASGVARIEHLEDAGRAFQNTFNAGDVDGLVSLFDSEGVLVPAFGGVAVGSDALRELFTNIIATGARLEIVEVFDVHRVGDIALATIEWKVDSADPDGNPITIRTRPAVVFRRQVDGSWRFLCLPLRLIGPGAREERISFHG